MSDELAQVLTELLRTIEAYDSEQPVQTRLSRKHDAMAYAMLKARESLAVYSDYKARMLDGGPSPRYLVATDGHIIDTGEDQYGQR